MTIYVAPRYGSFATQSTVIRILTSMNLHLAICVVCGCMAFDIYIPNSILRARNDMSLQYIFNVALPVTIFTIFHVLQFLPWPRSEGSAMTISHPFLPWPRSEGSAMTISYPLFLVVVVVVVLLGFQA